MTVKLPKLPPLIAKPTKTQLVTFALGAAGLIVATFAPQYVAGYERLIQLLGALGIGAGTPFAQGGVRLP